MALGVVFRIVPFGLIEEMWLWDECARSAILSGGSRRGPASVSLWSFMHVDGQERNPAGTDKCDTKFLLAQGPLLPLNSPTCRDHVDSGCKPEGLPFAATQTTRSTRPPPVVTSWCGHLDARRPQSRRRRAPAARSQHERDRGVSTVTSSLAPWPVRRGRGGGGPPREYWSRARPDGGDLPEHARSVRYGEAKGTIRFSRLQLSRTMTEARMRGSILPAAQDQTDLATAEIARASPAWRRAPPPRPLPPLLSAYEIGIDGALKMRLVDQHHFGDELR